MLASDAIPYGLANAAVVVPSTLFDTEDCPTKVVTAPELLMALIRLFPLSAKNTLVPATAHPCGATSGVVEIVVVEEIVLRGPMN